MTKHFYSSIFVLFFSTTVFAQTQIEMNESADKKYKAADAELNKVYKSLMAKLEKEEKPLLVAAEKDWIKFRDSHCKFEGSIYEGGSMQPMIISNCLEKTTKRRIAEIKESIKDRSN